MKIQVVHSDVTKIVSGSLLIPTYEDKERFDPFTAALDEILNGSLTRLAKSGEVSGKFKEYVVLHPEVIPISHLILIGVGKREAFNLDKLRSVVARGGRIARRLFSQQLAVPVGSFLDFEPGQSAEAVTEGLLLGLYGFNKYKSKKPDAKQGLPKELILVVEDSEEVSLAKKGGERGSILAESANFVRDLVNEPSNQMTPRAFADEAKRVAKDLGLSIKILDKPEIEALGMGAFLSVAQGSQQPPKLIVLEYKGGDKGAFTLGLVGKGVTFDSGGISIKPSDDMQYMTSDMGGAAACLGAVQAIAKLKMPINIIAVLPLAENLPDGNAYKPGDIVKSFVGKTIEIINTDAEGRLLLADALGYICKMKVDAVVDLATLTGGVVVALGHVASGVFSTHEKLLEELLLASKESYEPIWQLPLFEEYTVQVKSGIADLKNTGGRYAAPCTAAAFLREFVGDIPWAHLDIAGTARVDADKIPYQQHPYLPRSGATGVGVRILTFLAERLSRKKSL